MLQVRPGHSQINKQWTRKYCRLTKWWREIPALFDKWLQQLPIMVELSLEVDDCGARLSERRSVSPGWVRQTHQPINPGTVKQLENWKVERGQWIAGAGGVKEEAGDLRTYQCKSGEEMKVRLPRRGVRVSNGANPQAPAPSPDFLWCPLQAEPCREPWTDEEEDVCRVPTPSANMYRGVYWKMKWKSWRTSSGPEENFTCGTRDHRR